MDHIQTIDAGNADGLHRFFLNLAHHGSGMFAGVRLVVHNVQDGTHFILADNPVQLGRIQGLVGIVLQRIDGQLDQLTRFFLQGHPLEDLFYFGFYIFVGRNGLRAFGGACHHQQQSAYSIERSFHICQS